MSEMGEAPASADQAQPSEASTGGSPESSKTAVESYKARLPMNAFEMGTAALTGESPAPVDKSQPSESGADQPWKSSEAVAANCYNDRTSMNSLEMAKAALTGSEASENNDRNDSITPEKGGDEKSKLDHNQQVVDIGHDILLNTNLMDAQRKDALNTLAEQNPSLDHAWLNKPPEAAMPNIARLMADSKMSDVIIENLPSQYHKALLREIMFTEGFPNELRAAASKNLLDKTSVSFAQGGNSDKIPNYNSLFPKSLKDWNDKYPGDGPKQHSESNFEKGRRRWEEFKAWSKKWK